jgi:hypothetical protein
MKHRNFYTYIIFGNHKFTVFFISNIYKKIQKFVDANFLVLFVKYLTLCTYANIFIE